ncbi:MAG: RMD1 family protein [Candidatus Paracaedibacteraceae bacterium]|nr:RMD1 family protein [Candidatus Paracaedibacteraceae bacterium]
MRCASYCNAERYEIDELARFLRKQGMDPKFYDNVIHIHKMRESNEDESQDAEIYIFPYGCVSLWGLTEEEEHNFISEIKAFEILSLSSATMDASIYDYGETTLINEEDDEIILESGDDLIKLSISHGLTQSVKMEAFEQSIARTIERTYQLPAELAQTGKISMSRKKISQKIGALFAERNSINLHCDILDTPEFFWRRPRYETYYHMASEYMDIKQRLDILNKRLDVIHELYDILSNELKHAHSSRLEWIIILLIVTEVLMTLFKDILHVF